MATEEKKVAAIGVVEKAWMVFREKGEKFVAEIDEVAKRCIELKIVFPVRFEFADGRVIEANVSHTCDRYAGFVHDLHATNFWFRFQVHSLNEAVGQFGNLDSRAIVWMDSRYNTYYYDKFGLMEFVDSMDNEGEDLPDSPKTCTDCGHEFRVSVDFEGDLCSACYRYKVGEKEIPDFNSQEFEWDASLVPLEQMIVKETKKEKCPVCHSENVGARISKNSLVYDFACNDCPTVFNDEEDHSTV